MLQGMSTAELVDVCCAASRERTATTPQPAKEMCRSLPTQIHMHTHTSTHTHMLPPMAHNAWAANRRHSCVPVSHTGAAHSSGVGPSQGLRPHVSSQSGTHQGTSRLRSSKGSGLCRISGLKVSKGCMRSICVIGPPHAMLHASPCSHMHTYKHMQHSTAAAWSMLHVATCSAAQHTGPRARTRSLVCVLVGKHKHMVQRGERSHTSHCLWYTHPTRDWSPSGTHPHTQIKKPYTHRGKHAGACTLNAHQSWVDVLWEKGYNCSRPTYCGTTCTRLPHSRVVTQTSSCGLHVRKKGWHWLLPSARQCYKGRQQFFACHRWYTCCAAKEFLCSAPQGGADHAEQGSATMTCPPWHIAAAAADTLVHCRGCKRSRHHSTAAAARSLASLDCRACPHSQQPKAAAPLPVLPPMCAIGCCSSAAAGTRERLAARPAAVQHHQEGEVP
jgi:hypothetical protein